MRETASGGSQAASPVLGRLVVLCALLLAVGGARAQDVPADTTAAVPVAAPTDGTLEARLRGVFAEIDEFDDVRVTVRSGVVRLTGTALTAEAREAAETLAGRFEGVVYVDNDLDEVTSVEDRVTPALDKVRGFGRDAVARLPVFGIALLVLLVFVLLGRLMSRWDGVYDRLGVNPLLRNFIRRLLRLAVVTAGLLLALEILDATALVGAVLGTAGVAGLAIGFAFQDIVENYLAGALLSLRRPFAVSDHVLIGDQEGLVIRLTAREMVLMTLDGNHISIPNATVFKSVITNYTRNPRRRFDFAVGVGVQEDLDAVQQTGLATLRGMQGVLDDPRAFARVEDLGDSNVVVRFHAWVDQRETDLGKARSEAVRLVKTAFDEAGIAMPEPIYAVHLRSPEDGADAPRPPRAPAPPQQDVAPDDDLTDQVREDLRASDEPNYL